MQSILRSSFREKRIQTARQLQYGTPIAMVNIATRYYEELLLTLRQQPVVYRDGSASNENDARQNAIKLANDVRALNGKAPLIEH